MGEGVPIRGNSACKRIGACRDLEHPGISGKFSTAHVEEVCMETGDEPGKKEVRGSAVAISVV